MAAPGRVDIRLLGGFEVSVGGGTIPDGAWRLRKAKTLVKLLALAPGKRLHTGQLGELLWPDRDATAVRNNLHQTLRAARSALTAAGVDGREMLRLRDGMVGFDESAAIEVDADTFVLAIERARTSDSLEALLAAAGRYTGELLPEDRYEDWATERREALREQHTAVLLEVARRQADRDDTHAAIGTLRQLLVEHELHEPARRELMQLLAGQGRRQEALAEYEALQDALKRTLEASPDLETRRLYRRLLAGSLEQPEPDAPELMRGRTNNLPEPVSSFVGRDRELAEVERLLATTRLLTLTGVGGAGKTRLAIEVARARVDAFEHGVWLVDLAPTADADQVPAAIAEVLGLELPERGAPIPPLAEQLSTRRLLLVLDNCEHLVTACAALVTTLLRSCRDVSVLATSREALRVEGEVAWRVPSLALPDLKRLPDHTRLARQASVRLFCERARAADLGFDLNPRNARTIAELCVRLDGMPLALELAAARVSMLSPAQILARLGDALSVLGDGSRGALSRQRTLGATLDWSHDLLSDDERTVFRRLAVFAGSFPLEAAEHVCGVEPLSPGDVLARLARLVDQSLVVKEARGEFARYRLLETVRQYARDRLTEAAEVAAIRQRHREWYREWAEARDPERTTAAGEDTLHHFDAEHDNLRAALHSSLVDQPETALCLATSLWRFWLARGHFAEGRRWLEAALEANPAKTARRARGLIGIAVLDMRYAARPERLVRVAHEVVEIHRALPDEGALAQALHLAAVVLWTAHHLDEAERQLDQAAALATKLMADHLLVGALHSRGVVELTRGRPAAAQARLARCDELLTRMTGERHGFLPALSPGFSLEWDDGHRPRILFEETIVMGHRLGAHLAVAQLRFSQAWAARAAGDLDAAITAAQESAAAFAGEGWDYGVASAENLLGNLHRLAGDLPEARQRLGRSLQLRARLGDRRATGVTLTNLGVLAAAEGDTVAADRYQQRALRLFERIDDGFGETGTVLNLGVSALRGGDLGSARRLFGQVQEVRGAPGMRRPSGWVSVMLAEIAQRQHDGAAAERYLAEAHETFRHLGEEVGLAHCASRSPSTAAG